MQANDFSFGYTLLTNGFLLLKFFLQNTTQLLVNMSPDTQSSSTKYNKNYVKDHTNLSSRKSLSKLGECCSKNTSASKPASIDHSPRDNVFRMLKLGHFFSSQSESPTYKKN
jgi:hypothetical protein